MDTETEAVAPQNLKQWRESKRLGKTRTHHQVTRRGLWISRLTRDRLTMVLMVRLMLERELTGRWLR